MHQEALKFSFSLKSKEKLFGICRLWIISQGANCIAFRKKSKIELCLLLLWIRSAGQRAAVGTAGRPIRIDHGWISCTLKVLVMGDKLPVTFEALTMMYW